MRPRIGAAAGLAVVTLTVLGALAACSSVVSGQGAVTGSRAPASASPGAPSGASPGASSGGSSGAGPIGGSASGPGGSPTGFPSTTAGAALRYPRPHLATAVGDPPTADLCKVIGLDAFSGYGYTPVFAAPVYPPGCTVRMNKASGEHITVSVFGTTDAPAAGKRTLRRQSGQPVYAYAYDAKFGNCERDIAARGVVLKVNAFQPGGAKAGKALTCRATDAMTAKLVTAIGAHSVPRLAVASPSVLDQNGCSVLRASTLQSLSAFAGSVHPDAMGAGCSVQSTAAVLYVDPGLDRVATPTDTVRTVVGGHVLYADNDNASEDVCTYTSVQGTTSDGFHELVIAEANPAGTEHVPDLCNQTAQGLAAYLDSAGLK